MNTRHLYRSRRDRRLAGVAGGVAEYFDIDPSLVRILWVVSVFFGGFTLLLYIVMAIIVPSEPWVAARGSWQPAGPAWGQPLGAARSHEPGEAGEAADPAAPGAEQPGGTGAPDYGPAAPVGWQPGTQPPAYPRRDRGSIGWFFGAVLILFGSIALAGQVLPDLADHGRWLWPAFILGLGVLVFVSSVRRPSREL